MSADIALFCKRVGSQRVALFCLLALALIPLESQAQIVPISSPMGDAMCLVINVVYGNFGRALACIGVITIGIQAMLGRVTWLSAVIVVVGIAIVFGSIPITILIINATNATPGAGGNCI